VSEFGSVGFMTSSECHTGHWCPVSMGGGFIELRAVVISPLFAGGG